jgi:Arc/MetJ-type ribon-helix-helix transcriptional regulator
MTTTFTIRLPKKEKEKLARYGKISEVVRDALSLYLREKNSRRIIGRLKELQRSSAPGTLQEDLRSIRADRDRRS